MDLDQLVSFLKSSLDPPTINTSSASQSESSALQPLPKSSWINQSLSLLKEFCSNEDTVKKYLLNDESDNLDHEQLFSSLDTFNSFIKNWLTYNDPKPTSIDSLLSVNNLSPGPSPISSYICTDPQVVESLYQSKIDSTYDNLKLNFIGLVQRGYKLTLSLNDSDNEVEEPWNPDVSQKIMSVYFSSLSMRSEFLSDDNELSVFESLLMAEAFAAFKGQKNLNLFSNLHERRRAKASPDKLISQCNHIKGFRKIEKSDKITLLCSIYNHLHSMDGIANYDPTIDGWDAPASDFKFDRRDAFLFNQFLHDSLVHVIETFPERMRNDINVIILLYLIIIFNPDEPKLKYSEIIRHEQYSYIYLLRRYLRTICKSDCDAADNHYKLMVKIEQLRLLSIKSQKDFYLLLTEPFEETIARSVTLNNIDINW